MAQIRGGALDPPRTAGRARAHSVCATRIAISESSASRRAASKPGVASDAPPSRRAARPSCDARAASIASRQPSRSASSIATPGATAQTVAATVRVGLGEVVAHLQQAAESRRTANLAGYALAFVIAVGFVIVPLSVLFGIVE